MNKPSIQRAVEPVISVFSQLQIPYYIGGSVASSTYGVARATLDVDIVVDLKKEHVDRFASMLQDQFYLDKDTIRSAVKNYSSFNLIHLETLFKVDIFIVKNRPYDLLALQRKKKDTLNELDRTTEVYLASCEDIILNKLDWFHKGGDVSQRQWHDIAGIIKVQGANLDKEYLLHWARQLGLQQLLQRALSEAAESGSL